MNTQLNMYLHSDYKAVAIVEIVYGFDRLTSRLTTDCWKDYMRRDNQMSAKLECIFHKISKF